jgi:hypothetical protein
MAKTTSFDQTTRHYVFLTAAWIANIDGSEDDREIDALCQLRKALGIPPSVARHLHHMARSAAFAPPQLEGGWT